MKSASVEGIYDDSSGCQIVQFQKRDESVVQSDAESLISEPEVNNIVNRRLLVAIICEFEILW